MGANLRGLTTSEAAERLDQYGANSLKPQHDLGWLALPMDEIRLRLDRLVEQSTRSDQTIAEDIPPFEKDRDIIANTHLLTDRHE